ncbi:MAG: HD domain-containing protein [Chloroflexi bacterium]|nr:HD domain-containing protein [Chloroflexota bacterium]
MRQGVRALLSLRVTPDLSEAAAYLTVPQLALFRHMSHIEQVHALNVLRTLLANLPQDGDPRALDDLAVAALLHDVGKSRHPVRIWQKTLPVLVGRAAPGLYDELVDKDPRHWLWRAFAVKRHHPAWGAEMARTAHAPERVVWLIEHHQDDAAQWENHPHVPLLRALQAADDAN